MNPESTFVSGGNVFTYFDIAIGEEKIGRLVFELFTDKAPFAAYNFYHTCVGTSIPGFDKEVTYKNNYFHRVIKSFMIQAGDVMFGSNSFEKSDNIGKGGCSIYAKESELKEDLDIPCYGNFIDENMVEFTEPFYVAMANAGIPNTNSSQFFITTSASPHLNGKHTILGKVIHGKSIIHTIENVSVDSDGFPKECIRIENCGAWDTSMEIPLYNACNDPIGNDIYEEYPDDDRHFDPEDFAKALEAANIIKESGTLLFKKKDFQNAYYKYKKSLNYVNEFIPDSAMDKEHNVKFTNLKMKLYLNICLVFYNLEKYDKATTYANYLLDMEKVPNLDKAKAYYRRGNCLFAKKRFEDALKDYKSCKENNENDRIVDKKIEQVEGILEKKKEKTKRSLAKFFD